MPAAKTNWDAELYEAKHAFVWKFGEDLLAQLDPKPGERILDLGCGPGQLTSQIANRGADVVGVDISLEMIGQARQNYPGLRFVLADAAKLEFTDEFDAIFSNAALHWMLDAAAVARSVSRALRRGGRFVAELGGRGNIRRIEQAIAHILEDYGFKFDQYKRTYFPSVAEYAVLLEDAGLEVRFASLFDRPTPLEGADGMKSWLQQFGSYYFDDIPLARRESALASVVERLKPELLVDGRWQADYRRLRVTAYKT